MPKTSLKLSTFHQGLNSNFDPRDVSDTELTRAIDVSVDNVGRIILSGNAKNNTITTNGSLTLASLTSSTSRVLFRFSSDYGHNGTKDKRTDYIIIWDDTNGKLWWLPSQAYDNSSWGANTTWLAEAGTSGAIGWDDFSTRGVAVSPDFYYVDGALRIFDTTFLKDSKWFGVIDRTLFGDNASIKHEITSQWVLTNQTLESPTSGDISYTKPAAADVANNSIYWHLRNVRDVATHIHDFDEVHTKYSDSTIYDLSDTYDSSDESWQTAYRGLGGNDDTYYHGFGIAFYEEDDDASITWKWTSKNPFNTSGAMVPGQSVTRMFSSGESIYLAIRLPSDEIKNMWLGSHYAPVAGSGNRFISISIDACYIKFFAEDVGGDYDETCYKKYLIDITKFTESQSGVWHILEFPYDEPYENGAGTISPSFPVNNFEIEMRLSWEREGAISSPIGDGNNNNNNIGIDLFQLSDLRIGERDLVGVQTTGEQEFQMSYTYDDKENESLLYNFGADNKIQLKDSESQYKIGIEAYVKAPTNLRVTGSNLYIIDEGIAYRIAELRYIKGLRGSWESQFPSEDQWLPSLGTGDPAVFIAKTSLLKTDGLPLLESFSAMNGYSPDNATTSAKFKTAVVLNRQVYIGNVQQDEVTYGDRMIKTNTNDFDTFPIEGNEIDVIVNDGDDIIKLEAYADRILQFKRNVMYLINATRSSEYLEDTFIGKGVVSPNNVCKTDMGIAWVNENGCYFYDGERVHNLTDEKIDRTDWSTFINDYSDVIYSPIDKKIIIAGSLDGTAGDGQDLYEYSFYTKSWSSAKEKLDVSRSNFILDIDEKIKYVTEVDSSYYLKKWVDSSIASDYTSEHLEIMTKDFDFGNPAQRKKCFKFYVTYKSTGDSKVQVFYDTNGGTSFSNEMDANSKFAGTSTSCYEGATNGLKTTSGVWKQAELKPETSVNNVYSVRLKFKAIGGDDVAPKDFAINDITIVYREKPLK